MWLLECKLSQIFFFENRIKSTTHEYWSEQIVATWANTCNIHISFSAGKSFVVISLR